MKTLEKKEMKNIQGGDQHGCYDNHNGTTSCYAIYDNGWACTGMYEYSGKTIELECFQAI